MGAIFSFLGGGAFRAIWGELSTYFTKRQDHKLEMQTMQLQGQLDAAAHGRHLEEMKLQSSLGVTQIRVQADADVSRTEAQAFLAAQAELLKPSGIRWVDAWNGIIRPSFASVALILWCWFELRHLAISQWVITAWSMDMVGTIAGFYFADRTLGKRGK